MLKLQPLMINTTSSILFILFLCFALYDIYDAKRKGKRYLKPFLMPLISLYYIEMAHTLSLPIQWLLIIGLICGCLGDIFLIKTDEKSFLKGLISFFLCHLMYVLLFLKNIQFSYVSSRLYFAIIPYLLLIYIIYSKLKDHVPSELLLPVKAYMAIIVSMSFFALLQYDPNHFTHFIIGYVGSLFFMLSDTILSFHLFANKSHLGIMTTYLIAQFLIAYSFLV